jgi:hypothetical protein
LPLGFHLLLLKSVFFESLFSLETLSLNPLFGFDSDTLLFESPSFSLLLHLETVLLSKSFSLGLLG